jgi:CBS domain-containing protein
VLIEHILHRKGREVATVASDATVGDAVALLHEWNVGALVVAAEGKAVAGILSERDVVRALAGAKDAPALMTWPVSNLMTTDVTTCGPRATVDELAKLMTDRRIRHIPVLDGDALVGIVSIGDVVKSRIDELQAETDSLHDYLSSGR